MQQNIIISFQNKNKPKNMNNKENFTAILFFKPGTLRPRKYNNINNLFSFYKNVAEKSKCYYFNIYEKKSGIFVKRIWVSKS